MDESNHRLHFGRKELTKFRILRDVFFDPLHDHRSTAIFQIVCEINLCIAAFAEEFYQLIPAHRDWLIGARGHGLRLGRQAGAEYARSVGYAGVRHETLRGDPPPCEA